MTPRRDSLIALFSDLDQHFELRLEPALIRARRSAEAVEDAAVRHTAAAVLDVIDRVVHAHVDTVRRTLSPVAAAIDIGADVAVDRQILRHLALDHAMLAARAKDLQAIANQADGALADAAPILIREIEQHVAIANNYIFPRLEVA